MEHQIDLVDIHELMAHEDGLLLYKGAEGVIVRRPNGTVMSDILDGEVLCAHLKELALPDLEQCAVKSRSAVEALRRHFGFTGENPCTQWEYCREQPPERQALDIRPLTEEYAQIAAEHYHLVDDSAAYVRWRIAEGRMWGLFENGALAGFIGMHSEGSMGMLEIFPEYRRKGYGYQLEAFLIEWHLRQGRRPYCHVVDGNDASVRLQTKLGLTKGTLPVIWVY